MSSFCQVPILFAYPSCLGLELITKPITEHARAVGRKGTFDSRTAAPSRNACYRRLSQQWCSRPQLEAVSALSDSTVTEVLDCIAGSGEGKARCLEKTIPTEAALLAHLCKSADSGEALEEEEQAHIDQLLEKLESTGKEQQPRPLENPLLFGNFNVAYVSTRQAPGQDGKRELPYYCAAPPGLPDLNSSCLIQPDCCSAAQSCLRRTDSALASPV